MSIALNLLQKITAICEHATAYQVSSVDSNTLERFLPSSILTGETLGLHCY